MATCAHIDSTTGALIPDTTPVASCTAYIVQDQTDYLTNSVFNIPDASDISAVWALGFLPPMILGLVARCMAEILDTINDL